MRCGLVRMRQVNALRAMVYVFAGRMGDANGETRTACNFSII